MDKASKALWGGIGFCCGWTLLIWFAGGRLESIAFLPDEGYSWYFWKLPEKSVLAWWSAWGLYTVHQLAHFGLIYYAQKHVRGYTNGLHPVNIAALVLNGVFVLLHFVQTHLWFDGLAQDHPPQYPQYAVIVLLVWVLLMENDRRGLFFGKKLPIGKQIGSFARRYHGYFFSWAILYTFWYHPMYPSLSHLSGFFYTMLIMLQGSLFFTRIHTNRYWTLLQEALVAVHATIVASYQTDIWPMFLFGFAGVFVVTQMHGVGFSRWVRVGLGGLYLVGGLWVYSERGFGRATEVLRIPVADYVLVLILAGLMGGGLLVYNLVVGKTRWGRG